jgi:hypothetical protein
MPPFARTLAEVIEFDGDWARVVVPILWPGYTVAVAVERFPENIQAKLRCGQLPVSIQVEADIAVATPDSESLKHFRLAG